MVKKHLRSLLIFICITSFQPLAAFAQLLPSPQQQGFVVSDIFLENLQRVAPTTLFSLININIGDTVTDVDIANLIRDVYASGFFADVEVLREEGALIIRVVERPSIASVEIEGNKLIPEQALQDNMATIGLVVGEIFVPSTLEQLQIALEGQYISQGLYGASVNVEIEELPRNRVALTINVTEGEAASIVHINIVGNEVFSDEELLDLFELRTTGFWSFITNNDQYSRESINGDLERLTSYYNDQGYINFTITSTQVSLSPNREEVYITINVDEGDIYRINQVELAGDLVGNEEILRRMLQIRQDQIFSQQLVTLVSESMTRFLGSQGYFFAEVEGVPIVDEEAGTVDVTFFVDPGERTYVNRINFIGNTTTADEVLRREMLQMEGAPASAVAIEQGRVELERLGYFANVEYETTDVPGVPDQIDVNYSVEEQLSGQIGGSIGYSQVQGLVLSANIQDRNFLGTGNQVGLGVNTSRFSTNYSFNFLNPFYTIDGVSRGFSLSYSKSDYAELNLASYTTNQFNAAVNFGYPIGSTQRLNFSLGYSNTEIDTGFGAVQEIKFSPEPIPDIDSYIVRPAQLEAPFLPPQTAPLSALPEPVFRTGQGFIDREGDSFNDVTLTVNWLRSTFNFGLFPTAGSEQNVSVQFAVPGSELSFYRLRLSTEHLIPLFGEWILRFRGDLGYGGAYGDTGQLPFFRNFTAGGLGSIRGFERNTLGPRSTTAETYLTGPTDFLRDADGDLILNDDGNPMLDPSSPRAYVLKQAVDAQGRPIFDAAGNPVFTDELATSPVFNQRPLPFGGNILTTGTAELLFPLPFLENRSRIRSGFFIDAGNVFSSYCTAAQEANNNCSGFDFDDFRYSTGFSVSWFSGFMGVMTFSLAKPFNSSGIDETESFQFDIGTAF